MVEAAGLGLGIEIGGTKLQIFAGNGAKILERHRFSVDPSAGGAGIRSQLEKSIPELANRLQPQAIGVGFGGPVDVATGRICRSHQIEGWSEFPLGLWLAELAGAPVIVDNDANAAALGEALHGAGRGFGVVFYVTLGSGVGGGLVRQGAIYHGAKPGESEIGHVRLDKSGVTLESRCSGWAVDARVRAAVAENPSSALARGAGAAGRHEATGLAAALQAADADAVQIVREVADDLAFGLSHVTHLFHPEVIVLGGGLSLVGEPLRQAVAGALPRYVMEAFGNGPKVALSQLREDAVPVGALALVSGSAKGG